MRIAEIYIAAPDFDYMDTTHIDTVAKSLTYHNFTPRLPVRENGQMGDDDSIERKKGLFDADMAILGQCQLLLAVMLNNDPGTLIEIGLAAAKGIPVLVYDPHRIAKNLMLTELPALVSSDLDEIVAKVFDLASRLV